MLSGVLATTLSRTVNRGIMKYNEHVTEEGAAETTGGKLVHANVLRRPEWSIILSGCAHFFLMSLITISFAGPGVLSKKRWFPPVITFFFFFFGRRR